MLAYAFVSNLCFFHRRIPAEELLLYFSQRRACLNQIDRLDSRREALKVANCLDPSQYIGLSERGPLYPHPQNIIHQRSLSRPNFHQFYPGALPPLRDPFRDCPYADKLSKNLCDLRRCDEIALLAEYFRAAAASRVVSAFWRSQDLAHKCSD